MLIRRIRRYVTRRRDSVEWDGQPSGFVEPWSWGGQVTMTVVRHGRVVARYEGHNDVMDVARTALLDALTDVGADTQITWLAWGTGAGANNPATRTILDAEAGRKPITAQTGPTGTSLLTSTYISPQDANGVTIAELGWFGGAAAGPAADSGLLIGRVLVSPAHAKDADESIQVDRTDTFA